MLCYFITVCFTQYLYLTEDRIAKSDLKPQNKIAINIILFIEFLYYQCRIQKVINNICERQ